jgi:hypothetical protein
VRFENLIEPFRAKDAFHQGAHHYTDGTLLDKGGKDFS